MPAGYLEADEDPKACAAREALGETGYTVKICDLLGIYTYDNDPRGIGVVLLYSGEIISGKIKKNHEMLQVKYFYQKRRRRYARLAMEETARSRIGSTMLKDSKYDA